MSLDSIQLSQDLIRCPSITPEDAGAMHVVEHALEALGFTCHRLEFGGVQNLYARRGEEEPNLCFAGHVDVVPVGDITAWDVDPFEAEIKDGVLYGRGAVDMKPAIAAWVAAIAAVVSDQSSVIRGSLSLLITGDEEASGENGTRKVLEWLKERGEQVDACIVGEPTNPEKLGDMIKIGRRGSLDFVLTVQGVQGHAAYPDLADNPITKLVAMLHSLKEDKLDAGTEFFPPSNLEITSVDVGNPAGNVIPAKAEAKFNIRFNDKWTRDSLIAWVQEHCDQVTSQYMLEMSEGSEAFLTQPGALSETVQRAVKSATGLNPELSTTGGTSDARFIKDLCPVVECGLINKTAHKVNEHIPVADIHTLTEIYKGIIERYLGG